MKRIGWIDFLKIIGIICVILGHGLLPSNGQFVVYTFHMPLFFILSGVTAKPIYGKERIMAQIIKTSKRLLVPYVLMSFSIVAFAFIFFSPTLAYLYSSIGGIFLGNAYRYGNFIPATGPLWFLVALFWIKIIWILSSQYGSNKQLLLILFCIGASIFLRREKIDLFFSLDSALLAYPFFAFGTYFWRGYNRNKHYTPILLASFFCLAVVCILLHFSVNSTKVDIAQSDYGRSILLFYATGITVSLFLILSTQWIVSSPWLKIASDSTILLLGYNLYCVRIIERMQNFIGYSENLAIAVLGAIGSVVAFYPITLLVRRYFPLLLGEDKNKFDNSLSSTHKLGIDEQKHQ
ncbi:acyltransferase family protein [Porphyromonas levii]|uniref:acyltransferase family protein n=1 Tax=Porphyromonas levii TaxID=28114 RepID=UPI001B8D48D3|nr:acyltransferase family protein [Porphyromonas levii]MBR8769043.1 hypothetical protein [Porphyromonas levii]